MNCTKIEWTDYTWNPITGCKHGCWYCYAKKLFTRFNRSFEPTFHPERLSEPAKLKKPAKIFCCSVSDIFAEWTKPKWRKAVLTEIQKYPQHTFQLLTKQPQLINGQEFGKNTWVGVTINNQQELLDKAEYLRSVKAGIRFLSFEPLLGEVDALDLYNIDWVIVGKLTGSKKIPLNPVWVQKIADTCTAWGVPIFIKNNIGWHEKIQEFPKVIE